MVCGDCGSRWGASSAGVPGAVVRGGLSRSAGRADSVVVESSMLSCAVICWTQVDAVHHWLPSWVTCTTDRSLTLTHGCVTSRTFHRNFSHHRNHPSTLPTQRKPMQAVPPSGFTYIKGTPINFQEEFGKGQKVFVLEFWATWCPPCRNSIPHLSELQQKYKDTVTFIGITSEDPTTVAQFVNRMGAQMDYTVVADTTGQTTKNYMEQFGIRGIPHAFIISKDGKVAYHGHPMEPAFEANLQEAVKQVVFQPQKLTEEQLLASPVKDLKEWLKSRGIDYSGCVEKIDLVRLIKSSS